MSLYEGMFVMDNRQANRDWDGSLEKLKGMLVKHGAEVVRLQKWGERKLAYEMDGRRRGTYVLGYFNATGKAVNQIYRECELSELTLRALILRTETIPTEEEVRLLAEGAESAGRFGRDFGRSEPSAPPAAAKPEAEAVS